DRQDDESSYLWLESNPNGFADWFADRQRETFTRVAPIRKLEILRQHPSLFASVADVPDQLVRAPLQRAVQLLKRHRDVRFCGHPDEADKPISIILTTLAATAYAQEPDVYSTMINLLDRIQRYQETGVIQCREGRWTIPNPTNPSENFADRWNDEGSRKPEAFFGWLDWLREDLDELLNAASPAEVDGSLRKAFGQAAGGRVAGRYRGESPRAYSLARPTYGRLFKSRKSDSTLVTQVTF
ncbi:MAG: hypothetical protein JNG90_18515, partial [Planctomycetaceae bacterium]|nr:hypothetical protein [Planctomycetaceae bacterium]